jgi:hypothetical protein
MLSKTHTLIRVLKPLRYYPWPFSLNTLHAEELISRLMSRTSRVAGDCQLRMLPSLVPGAQLRAGSWLCSQHLVTNLLAPNATSSGLGRSSVGCAICED